MFQLTPATIPQYELPDELSSAARALWAKSPRTVLM
jgi:hypothetical protein